MTSCLHWMFRLTTLSSFTTLSVSRGFSASKPKELTKCSSSFPLRFEPKASESTHTQQSCSSLQGSSQKKYRRINRSNPNFLARVGRFREGINTLLAAGFEEEGDDALVLPAGKDSSQLSVALSAVDVEIARVSTEGNGAAHVEAREEEERRKMSTLVRESMRRKKEEEAHVCDPI